MDKKLTPNQSELKRTTPERKPWTEPAIIFEQALEVRADGPPGANPDSSHFLGPLGASAGLGGGGTCT